VSFLSIRDVQKFLLNVVLHTANTEAQNNVLGQQQKLGHMFAIVATLCSSHKKDPRESKADDISATDFPGPLREPICETKRLSGHLKKISYCGSVIEALYVSSISHKFYMSCLRGFESS
jgi:hypothetical protein